MRVLTWNGKTIPVELRKLPPGRYAVESIDRVPRLTEREEAGLEAALASLAEGHGLAAEDVHGEARALVRNTKGGRKRRRG